MKWFIMIWRWLISPHCFCGLDTPICHKHETGHYDGRCPYCKHPRECHLETWNDNA